MVCSSVGQTFRYDCMWVRFSPALTLCSTLLKPGVSNNRRTVFSASAQLQLTMKMNQHQHCLYWLVEPATGVGTQGCCPWTNACCRWVRKDEHRGVLQHLQTRAALCMVHHAHGGHHHATMRMDLCRPWGWSSPLTYHHKSYEHPGGMG